MARFKKKPVIIEAIRVNDILLWGATSAEPIECPAYWIVDAYYKGTLKIGDCAVFVVTLEGTMRAEQTDWLIQGINGELYPCKPDIFEKTYEPVD